MKNFSSNYEVSGSNALATYETPESNKIIDITRIIEIDDAHSTNDEGHDEGERTQTASLRSAVIYELKYESAAGIPLSEVDKSLFKIAGFAIALFSFITVVAGM